MKSNIVLLSKSNSISRPISNSARRSRNRTVLLVCFLLAGVGYTGQTEHMAIAADQNQDVRKAIEEANKSFGLAFEKEEAGTIARMYTEDAELMPPNSDIIKGQAEIEKYWHAAMSKVKSVSLQTSEVYAFGDTAYEVGRYELRGRNQASLDSGKYLVIWKKVGNSWRLHKDCWNSCLAASRP